MLEIMPLGAGNEVGRSCVVMRFKGKTILFDCGIHPAYSGHAGLPFFDEIDPSEVDLLLVSHFHLDHAAALPYFMEKTTFKEALEKGRARVFMTHPTKAIYKMLLSDYLKVSNLGVEENLYDEASIQQSMDRIEVLNYRQEVTHSGIRVWCFNAGHVLGAAMFMVEVAGVRVLYTGDFSRQEDRHLMSAELPPVAPHVVVVESTYGVQIHEPREERERRFTTYVSDIVRRGGRCLIPVFALGRAQELLLILEEYWDAHPELQSVPIYYASALASKCMKVYQTYIDMMNQRIRQLFAVANPFKFRHIRNLKGVGDFVDSGPCVVMASPGMLQSGLSRELFERWCPDRRNGVILPGYCVEGTLAKHIMSEPPDIVAQSGVILPLHASVHYVSFSAHSDFVQTSGFLDLLRPPYVVLVHGDQNEMKRLRDALTERYAAPAPAPAPSASAQPPAQPVQVLTPKNAQAVQLSFRGEAQGKVVGRLGLEAPRDQAPLSGLLLRHEFRTRILHPQDLRHHTLLQAPRLVQRVSCPLPHPRPRAPLLRELAEQARLLLHPVELREDLQELRLASDRLRLRLDPPPRRSSAVPADGQAADEARQESDAEAIVLEYTSDPFLDALASALLCHLLALPLLDPAAPVLPAKRARFQYQPDSKPDPMLVDETNVNVKPEPTAGEHAGAQDEAEERLEILAEALRGVFGVGAVDLEPEPDTTEPELQAEAQPMRDSKAPAVRVKRRQLRLEVDGQHAVCWPAAQPALECSHPSLRRRIELLIARLFPATIC